MSFCCYSKSCLYAHQLGEWSLLHGTHVSIEYFKGYRRRTLVFGIRSIGVILLSNLMGKPITKFLRGRLLRCMSARGLVVVAEFSFIKTWSWFLTLKKSCVSRVTKDLATFTINLRWICELESFKRAKISGRLECMSERNNRPYAHRVRNWLNPVCVGELSFQLQNHTSTTTLFQHNARLQLENKL